MKSYLLPVGLLIVMLISSPQAGADTLLSTSDGTWNGSGWARQSNSSPKEAVRCRLNLRFSDARNRLRVSGKCTGGGRSNRIVGHISQQPNGTFTAQWPNPENRSQNVSLVGRKNGIRIALNGSYVSDELKKRVSIAMTWTISRTSLSIRSRQTSPTGGGSFAIQLKR